VLSLRGGTGKSTVAALLSGSLAGLRQDHVVAVDLDPDQGSLAMRSGPVVRPAAGRRTGERVQLQGLQDVARYLDHTAAGAYLWRQAVRAASGDPEEARAVALLRERVRFLNRYFAFAVLDCGPGLYSAVNRSVAADSHALVLSGTATVDGVLGVEQALRRLGAELGAGVLARTVVVLSAMTPQPLGVDLRRAVLHLSGIGPAVVLLPYDRHLAAGSAVEESLLAVDTRTAVLRVAAAVLDRAVAP
jgi:MinD-like ATPase involved in chromosome partitioning or flagellar assembly